jgi:hypothetical protein
MKKPISKAKVKSTLKAMENLFDKASLDARNAEGMSSHELTPLKEINKLEKEGDLHKVEQFKETEPQTGARFDALSGIRSITSPILSGAQEAASDGFAKIADFLNERVDVFTSSEFSDGEIKNISVLLAAESLKKPKDRCDILDNALFNFAKLRISKERQSRKEHVNMAIAWGIGQSGLKNPGMFDDIKGQIEKMAGRKN